MRWAILGLHNPHVSTCTRLFSGTEGSMLFLFPRISVFSSHGIRSIRSHDLYTTSKNIINSTGGSLKISNYTNTYSNLIQYFLKLYDSTTNKTVPIRRIGVSFNRLVSGDEEQLSLFENQEKITKERKIELAISDIKQKLGKNAIIRGMDLEEGATTILRNKLIGGHNAYD